MQNAYRKQHFHNGSGVEEISFADFREQVESEPLPILHLTGYNETLLRKEGISHTFSSTGQYWSFFYIEEGEGCLECESRKIPLRPGKVFLRRRDMENIVIRNTGRGPFRKRTFSILHSRFLDVLYGPFTDVEQDLLSVRSPERCQNILDRIGSLVRQGGERLYDELSILIYSFLLELYNGGQSGILSLETELRNAISHNPESFGNIESLMKVTNLSRQALFRYFAKTFQTTPMEYVIRARLEKSKWYLNCRPDLSTGEIARICGYRSGAFFSRAFKKHFGYTPGEFRSELYDGRIFSTGKEEKIF